MSRSWQDSSRPRDERLSDLLAEMTLEEKVAQLGSAFTGFNFEANLATDQQLVAPFQDAFEETPWDKSILDGLGQITRAFGTAPVSAAEGVARLAAMQRDLVDKTRLGIPAIAHEECLTGFTTYQATIYPTPLALAATFNPDLVRRIGRRIGDDLRSVGVHQGLAPVLDVVRDYRWGRVEETLGEDPYLVAIVGAAYVRGLESGGVIATLKHFVGYSASRAARNHAPVSMGPRELRDVMLPPFEVAVREGGARSVMNAYTDIDGVPVAADRELLTTLLRDEMGFTGVTVSDYWSISLLSDVHKVAASPAASGALALEAGVDVELPASRCYGAGLVDLVRGGQLNEAVVDRSVRRVLDQKLDLGLLDADYDPLSGVDPAPDLDNPENRAAAQLAAEESVILLANRGILPLTGPLRLAVVGPTAAEARSFLGCYSYPNHLLHRFPELGLGVPVPTLADAVVAEFPTTQVTTTPGCAINGTDTSGIAEAVTVVRRADVALVAVGDLAGMFGGGTSGEGCDAPDLALPGVQAELVRAVLATGTPTVLVCVSGRPYALGEFSDAASAIVQAFMPGQGAGSAIAGVMSGRVNPSGRLPVQIPAVAYGQPSTYLQSAYGLPGLAASSISVPVLYPFGHGLSYSSFEISDPCLSATTVDTDGRLSVSATITNTGARRGADVVQLYYSDPVAEVARPVIMLLGFARVDLDAGEQAKVTFEVSADRFAYCGRQGRIVDSGAIELMFGHSSSDIAHRALLEVTGTTRKVGSERTLTTPVTVERSVRSTGTAEATGTVRVTGVRPRPPLPRRSRLEGCLMLAAQYVAGRGIEVAEVDPRPPGPGEVQLEVAYVGICGTDLHILAGHMDERVARPRRDRARDVRTGGGGRRGRHGLVGRRPGDGDAAALVRPVPHLPGRARRTSATAWTSSGSTRPARCSSSGTCRRSSWCRCHPTCRCAPRHSSSRWRWPTTTSREPRCRRESRPGRRRRPHRRAHRRRGPRTGREGARGRARPLPALGRRRSWASTSSTPAQRTCPPCSTRGRRAPAPR